MKKTSVEESGAFVEVFAVEPSGTGVLSGVTFAVKDLVDVAGHVTGCGNPKWRETHPPAAAHAVCVEQLLAAGARCVGKTLTDEMAFSLLGENEHYGTPLNPKAPDRVPGGSSCGSASAVACQLADLAVGTDTGGSVRVPAANCGIFGLRPTHGRISVAGVNPLAPGLDTVGLFARRIGLLRKAASVLLGAPPAEDVTPGNIHILSEALDLADMEVQEALQQPLRMIESAWGSRVRRTSMREIDRETSARALENWRDIYRVMLSAESRSCLGAWVEDTRPKFGSMIRQSFEAIRELDRTTITQSVIRREHYFRRMKEFLGTRDLLLIPTIPSPAPLKGSIRKREYSGAGYYPRALSLTAIAGVARLPQVTLPVANLGGVPLGLSLIARHDEDAFLLRTAEEIMPGMPTVPE